MQNLSCRNMQNVNFPKIVAEKFALYIDFNNLKRIMRIQYNFFIVNCRMEVSSIGDIIFY